MKHHHQMDRSLRVKICGLTNLDDATTAQEAGAYALGFVMGGWVLPEEIEPRAQHVREFIQTLPKEAKPYLVTHLLKANDILSLADYLGVWGIQVSEYIDLDEMRKVRESTSRPIIKTIVTTTPDSLSKLEAYHPWCDEFLTDSRRDGYVGGTGVANDWESCRRVIELSDKPVWVAGGLNLENLEEAIRETGTTAVDVSTGVSLFSPSFQHKHKKDPEKIKAFISLASEHDPS